jgi:hypothetical protein
MKAAVLYEYDKEMNVELKLEMAPDPTINAAIILKTLDKGQI